MLVLPFWWQSHICRLLPCQSRALLQDRGEGTWGHGALEVLYDRRNRMVQRKETMEKLKTFKMVKKYEEKANREIVREKRYYICSTEANARMLELAASGHWKVESMHWQL